MNILHMPVKLNARWMKEFNDEGRTLPDGSSFKTDRIYIPREMFTSALDVVKLIKYTVALEY